MSAPALQVITFGHKLSPETEAWIRENHGEFVAFQVFFHAEQLHEVVTVTRRCFKQLAAKGCDMSGNTMTMLALPGLGIAVSLVVAAWTGVAGSMPLVLNLIRQTDPDNTVRSYYAPSPELPVVDLQSVRQDMGRKLRDGFFNTQDSPRKAA